MFPAVQWLLLWFTCLLLFESSISSPGSAPDIMDINSAIRAYVQVRVLHGKGDEHNMKGEDADMQTTQRLVDEIVTRSEVAGAKDDQEEHDSLQFNPYRSVSTQRKKQYSGSSRGFADPVFSYSACLHDKPYRP